jgi:23S rRNA (cytosine1962-C5)-methyltransferase
MDSKMGLLPVLAASRASRPRDTSPRDCRHAATNTGWSLRQGDCAACYSSASVRMRATIAEVLSMSDPRIAAELPALRLKRNEDRRLHAGHLWIFSNEVDTQQTPLPKFKPGELVRVLAHNDRALGLAYVNPKSLISARMLYVDDSRYRLAGGTYPHGAGPARASVFQPYYRLVYGESDGLPGLVVDRYGSACVVQIGTAGMEELKPQIQEALIQVLRCEALLFKNDSSAREMEGLPSYVETAKGKFDELSRVVEDGLEFQAPLAEGQKTGWFFDQAANRRALTKYVRKGARVLDVFSYVGAWGVRAAHSGAAEVLCVDSSAAALELAASNAELNHGR